MRRISRRTFLRSGGLAAVLAGSSGLTLLSGCVNLPTAPPTPAAPSPLDVPVPATPAPDPTATAAATVTSSTSSAGSFVPDVEINLRATPNEMQILPGRPTGVWTYQAELAKGDPTSLQPIPGSYLGPLIKVRKGQKVRVHFTNNLPEPEIVHWHGLIVPSRMDGHPRDAIQPGQTYMYEFEVLNRAGTYWFHPHPEPLTGSHVIRGLAGLFLVTDEEEAAAGLPSGPYDLPLVIQDRTFDQDNQLVYLSGGDPMAGMASMQQLMGFLGERILVNGHPGFVLPVATRAYRLRLLNGSNSRVYKLAWSHGAPLTVIATDGGLLEQPVQRPYVMLGPGERVELWQDFSQFPVGAEMTLQSLAFLGAEGDSLMNTDPGSSAEPATPTAVPAGMHGMMNEGHMSGMMGHMGSAIAPTPTGAAPGMETMVTPSAASTAQATGAPAYNPALPNGAAFPVLTVRVERQEIETLQLPTRLSVVQRHRVEEAVNGMEPRRFSLSMRGSTWLINGRSFKLEEVAEDEVVKVGSVEAWEFVNELNPDEPMEKMGMIHPMHLHGVQFQVIDREVMVPALKAGWDSVHEGYVDEGWKDTVLIMPGERVRLLTRFQFPDLFLFHCHNLEHEDLGMMRNYRADA